MYTGYPPPPPTPTQSTSAVVICGQSVKSLGGLVYNLYVVDADADIELDPKKADADMPKKKKKKKKKNNKEKIAVKKMMPEKKPILRIQGFGEIVFQFLNSTLYMFEGFPALGRDFTKNKSAYKYTLNLKSCEPNPGGAVPMLRKSDEGSYDVLPEMAKPKFNPVSIVAPDGERIVVFGYNHDFEVLDTKSETWTALPSPPHRNWGVFCPYIRGYGFAGDSVLVVTFTDGCAPFCLDLANKSENNCWSRYRFQSEFKNALGPFSVIEDEQLYLSSCAAGDLPIMEQHQDRYSKLGVPRFSRSEDCLFRCRHFFCLVSHDKNNKCFFWSLSTALDEVDDDNPALLAINVYCCDIKEYLTMKKNNNTCATLVFTPNLIKTLEYKLAINLGRIQYIVAVNPIPI